MRILQLIDSLRPGGAEKMAVTYANEFVERIEASFLCCTRLEGILKEQLSPKVGYLFLGKKFSLDPTAFKRLRDFVLTNDIHLIQAHGTSYFLGVLLKLSLPHLRLVWHEHLGRSHKDQYSRLLKFASHYFDAILTVNPFPEIIAAQLQISSVKYTKNFLPGISSVVADSLELAGGAGFHIICVANLREPKDHLNLLQAFKMLPERKIHLHLLGKDYQDDYSQEVKDFITKHGLEARVHLYGVRTDVETLLLKADLGVLSSSLEGLPMALLEYGRAGIPVVCTRVGACPDVLNGHGILVPSGNPEALAEGITSYLKDENRREKDAKGFQKKISREFSEEAVITEVLEFYKQVTSIS